MSNGGSGRSSSPQPVITSPLAMGAFAVPSQPISQMISTSSGSTIPMTSSNSETSNPVTQPSVGATISQQRAASGQLQRAISPPTPAPSPQPEARTLRQTVTTIEQDDIVHPDDGTNDVSPLLKLFLREFPNLDGKERHAFLAHFVDLCNARELAHLSSLISPRLKVDFLSALPIEVSLQIMSYLDDPRTLARASCVSRFWRSLVNDEQTWKVMCRRYRFRQVPVLNTSASRPNALGVDTPDHTMEPSNAMENEATSTDFALLTSPEQQAQSSSVESSQVLGGLYDTYRARGLDPSTALSELKALHGLFLSKRAREIGVEERRRQLHALQHDNVFMNMLQDKTFVDRMSHSSMSEEDRQFYRQLESFVQEANPDEQTEDHGASSSRSHDVHSNESTSASVGWLSTGPPSTQMMGGAGDTETDPRTPIVPSSSRYFNPASALPLREMGRTLVSPTSRLGNYTSGLLTSLWDRAGGNATGAIGTEISPSQPPSTGDHGHSAEGHIDAEDDDVDMTEEETKEIFVEENNDEDGWDQQLAIEPKGALASESQSTLRPAGSTPHRSSSSSSKANSISISKRKPRFTPFARPGSEDDNGTGETSTAKPISVGLGRPSTVASRMSTLRSATTSEGGRSLGALSFDSNDAIGRASHDPFQIGSLPTPKRSISTGQGFPRASMLGSDPSRRSKPFSYKTHFKLAYQTESNWLRGGRLLTQHVSSDDASGDGATVTSLSIDDEWIIVGMANAKIHAFDARTGLFVRTLTGHSAGVWCLALISASGNKSTTSESTNKSNGKGKMKMGNEMEEDHQDVGNSGNIRPVGAYPYDNDRPLYTPTPDLNLIHHDPRPAASVFSPEIRHAELMGDDRLHHPSLPLPQHNTPWNSERNTRSIHESLHSNRSLTPQPERVTAPPMSPPPPRSAMEAAAAARASHMSSFEEAQSTRSWNNHTSRGAGLGSNFGSPCGSVAGYGNETAIVVSSGCDRDVRVWDLSTGECKYVLTGHRSTVRCLRVFEGRPIAISGSRDGTMRVWNVETGQLQHLLPGHQHSVRCLDLAGNLVASASYDCTARIWNVDTGKCIHVLRGHYHQLYAIAFDGVHVATGSLDTTVRIWDAKTGECIAMMQAHSSLVGQLQLTDSTLITGGSDGKVIVYSLKTMKTLYQLLAHDNSVTCLQFDDRFIVTGGNDGKVKLWNFRTGEFVRELCEASDQVWKVSFRDDKCVVLCKRNEKTAMDVISFRPIEESS